MKVFSLAILFLLILLTGCTVKKVQESSAPEPIKKPEEIKMVVEDIPTFQGGNIKSFEAWVQEHVKYPASADEKDIEGNVHIIFMVEPDGSVSNVSVLRGVDPALDYEAMQVVISSPKWEYHNWREGQEKARFTITVKFKKE
jgi:protein TonB